MLQPISRAFICWCVISYHASKHRLIGWKCACVYVYGCVLTLQLACHQVFLNNPCKNAIKAVCCATSSSSSSSRNTSKNMIVKSKAYQSQGLYCKIKQIKYLDTLSIHLFTLGGYCCNCSTARYRKYLIHQSLGSNSMHLCIWMGKRGDLSDLKYGVVIGARQAQTFQKQLIYWNFHAQPSLGLKESDPKL